MLAYSDCLSAELVGRRKTRRSGHNCDASIQYLFDEVVEILWQFWCEACCRITLSVFDQTEAYRVFRANLAQSVFGFQADVTWCSSAVDQHTVRFKDAENLVA